ncbi:MAG: tetratricopeptide repeat protein [Planctomycetaceae bacterium]|nr:tetratricopeptide repeat protein [Planctomycetaceae bacterium]
MSRIKFSAHGLCIVVLMVSFRSAMAQGPVRGSIIEDRAARKLVEAGDARLEADESSKAVEIWQSVIERYPTSRVRFEAHIRLGNYYLERDRAYDKARVQFGEVASEENRDNDQRAEATLKMGMCFYEARNFGKCFSVMRDVIEHFPVSKQVNQAYYYIGLGHFQLGHYSRAIDALEKVGTSMGEDDSQLEKVEAGKRLFVKIEDADLAALETDAPVIVQCETSGGDVEQVKCFPVGRNVRIVLGSVVTTLGVPQKNSGRLEVKGDDTVKVVYIDEHTADKQFNRQVLHEAKVVGDGVVSITDGAFAETLQGVVLGKAVNIQTNDPDRDLTDGSDQIEVTVEVHRAKTEDEMEQEAVALLASNADVELDENGQPKIARYRKVDELSVTLSEVVVETIRPVDDVAPVVDDAIVNAGTATVSTAVTGAQPVDREATTVAENSTESTTTNDRQAVKDTIHSGVFRSAVPLVRNSEVVAGDVILQAMPGDLIRVNYRDEKNTGEGLLLVKGEARCIEGNLGGVRVTRTEISDRELRVRTRLKTAHALTNIATRYKEFGLKRNADAKYESALVLCEEIMTEARQLGGRLLEETYVQLWKIYFEMDRLELAAAMAQRLQREFPNSGFVDDALLQLADVAVSQGNLNRAIGLYNRLVNMQTSQLRGEAQFGVAECYEKMAEATTEARAQQLFDRSFQEFKKVFDQFPDSGRVGEAVARMANYYYRQKDYARAIDTFETVLANHPDAKFLDVILFNYGRCLYRMDRRADARRRFDQLIGDYPESALAEDARKISDALARAGT